jgi:hypothetical protein
MPLNQIVFVRLNNYVVEITRITSNKFLNNLMTHNKKSVYVTYSPVQGQLRKLY